MSSPKILVIDDDYASRLMLKKVLEQEKYEVTTCSNGSDALNLLKEHKFDLVLTDLRMEGISGLDVLEQVKQLDQNIATILLTGHASMETAIEAVRLGANDYLLKPINLEELQIRVDRAFERLELEQRLYEAERQLTYNATIARANHEINQPLTVIISAIDMVRMEINKLNIKSGKLSNYLQLMHKSSVRIANILRKLREINSPVIQDVPLGMKMIDLEEEEQVAALADEEVISDQTQRYILMIEDEENLRQILSSILDSDAYKCILAANAQEGVDLYRADSHLIELVILDFNLPDADGLVVLRELQRINENVKVLMTSGFDVDDSIREGLRQGAAEFLRKPFNRQQVLEAVRKIYDFNPAN